MNTGIAVITLTVLAILLIVLRKRRIGRGLRIAIAVLLPIGIITFCAFPPKGPMIVFAWGYGSDLHLLEPLRQNQSRGWLSTTLCVLQNDTTYADEIDKYARNNWDGKNLYVDGQCWECGKPYARRGSYVLAILPQGFVFTQRQPQSVYDHMTKPISVSRTSVLLKLFPFALTISIALGLLPGVWVRLNTALLRGPRRSAHECRQCGYDIRWLDQDRCPECGHPIQAGQFTLPNNRVVEHDGFV